MRYIKKQVLAGEFMAGAWCNLGSHITTEIAANAGFDWILVDQEHGPGGNDTLLRQFQSIGESCAPLVRIPWNEMPRYKTALDLGAAGIMVPYIDSKEQAEKSVSYLRYPPEGVRGVAMNTRAAGYGTRFEKYFSEAHENLLLINQIETRTAVDNIAQIAQVDGVDVLFVGPLDLSISLGMPKRFDDPAYCEVLGQVGQAAKEADKAAGILLPSVDLIELVHSLGFTFVAVGSDGGIVAQGMKNNFSAMNQFKTQ